MKKINISKDWMLSFYGKTKSVDLPNDYAVTIERNPNADGGPSTGYFETAWGYYTKYLKLPDDRHHYILDVDGAYMWTTVVFNEYQMITHPHGYTPLLVDLTKHVLPGEKNKLHIRTVAMQPSTRWYSGAGIYRDVFLWEGGDIRIEPWDKFVTTPTLDTVCADYQISADRAAAVTLRAELIDADGNAAACVSVSVNTEAAAKTAVKLELSVADAHTWSPDSPYLYTLRTEILENDVVLDTDETPVGIRTISCSAETGLLLNGEPIKLRGGCIHHDHGVLGAAAFPAAEERKLTKLKKAGFNAIRTAHNPPSSALLEVADRIGLLIMDEAFDTWQQMKGGAFNYHMWFADWWERDISYMVLRDRNHPSVISYSIGNEIPESGGASNGAELSAALTAEIKKYDTTRLITSATYDLPATYDRSGPEDYRASFDARIGAKSWCERTAPYYAPLDICGYNYLYHLYEEHHKLFPERVIWGSETHALNFYHSWQSVQRNSYVIGDFTWTAWDNLGEAGTGRALWARDGVIKGISCGAYPWRTCYQGDFDLCGYRRPQSYFRECIWNDNAELRIFTTHPEHYGEDYTGTGWHWYDVLDTWTFADEYLGRPVKCEVYTTADSVDWYLNGRKLGTSVPQSAIAVFDIPYEKGEITAVAFRNGAECARASLHTVGNAAAVSVKPETAVLNADNRDLCYFDISVTDAVGDRIPDAMCELRCHVDGGELLGIFSGDPKNEDQYGSDTCHAFEGRAVAIVRTQTAGRVTVTIESEGLAAGIGSVQAEQPTPEQ